MPPSARHSISTRRRFGAALLFGVFCWFGWFGMLNATTLPTPASPTQRARFLAAEAALAAGRQSAYQELAATLRDYPLYPYLAIPAFLPNLPRATNDEVAALLAAHGDTPPGERLRRAWLQRLQREGRDADYVRFYVDNGSETRACLYRRALLNLGRAKEAFADLATIYLSDGSLPDACDPLFTAWHQTGGLTAELAWRRIDLLMANGQVGIARFQSRYLPEAERPWVAHWLAVHEDPNRLLEPPGTRHPRQARIVAHGIARLAGRDAGRALNLLERFLAETPAGRALTADAEIGAARAQIGLALVSAGETTRALKQLAALKAVANTPLDLQLRRLRAGLRLRAWSLLPEWIASLPAAERDKGEWQYWQARALAIAGHNDGAKAAYTRAAGERNFWGFLAAERVGVAPNLRHQPTPVPAARQQALFASPLAARIKELQALKRDSDLEQEWRLFTRTLDAEGLMAAALLAQRLEMPTRAIFTLARSGYWDDLELRFPILHRAQVREAAKRSNVTEDWIFATIRQESAFRADAVSSAGAIGLMQLLPGTAADMARQRGQTAPSKTELTDPTRNIQLGSQYLAWLRERFAGHEAIAIAAYNAGPGNARRWLPDEPIDADLWIATIPFRETRDYVARVLAYRAIYAHRLGLPPLKLAERLAPISRTMPARLGAVGSRATPANWHVLPHSAS